ncbi:hypothetical protein GCM10020216_095410 [Nonomuraea helvata]
MPVEQAPLSCFPFPPARPRLAGQAELWRPLIAWPYLTAAGAGWTVMTAFAAARIDLYHGSL